MEILAIWVEIDLKCVLKSKAVHWNRKNLPVFLFHSPRCRKLSCKLMNVQTNGQIWVKVWVPVVFCSNLLLLISGVSGRGLHTGHCIWRQPSQTLDGRHWRVLCMVGGHCSPNHEGRWSSLLAHCPAAQPKLVQPGRGWGGVERVPRGVSGWAGVGAWTTAPSATTDNSTPNRRASHLRKSAWEKK